MSAKKVRRKDSRTGKWMEFWMVDVKVQLPDGTFRQKRKVPPIQTRRGAEQYERELRQNLLDGTYVDEAPEVKRKTVAEFAVDFMTRHAEVHNKPSSVLAKRAILDSHLLPVFGSMALDEVGRKAIDAYVSDKLRTGLQAKSVNTHLAVLGKLLRTAVDWEELANAPRIKLLREKKPEFRYLTFEEADALLAGFDDPFWRTMALTAMRTGLRPGELRALHWRDVDLVRGHLMVRFSEVHGVLGTPKDHEIREVGLSDDALEAIGTLVRRPGGRVFCQPDGRPLTEPACRKPLRRAAKAAELERINWYTLRHTFASHLIMRGVALKVVQELMGHAGITMTLRYAHLSPESKREAVKVLGPAVKRS